MLKVVNCYSAAMQSNEKDGEDGWLASIEEEYLASMAAEPDYESQYVTERESSMRGMWSSFQESATSIAQLYRGNPILTALSIAFLLLSGDESPFVLDILHQH